LVLTGINYLLVVLSNIFVFMNSIYEQFVSLDSGDKKILSSLKADSNRTLF